MKKGVKREKKTTAKPPPSKIEPNPNGVNWVEKLPAEVRNQIYRDVLVDPEIPTIDISTTPLPLEPPLLGTNQQIRSEARGVFWKEFKFEPLVKDFDVDPLVRWLDADPDRRDGMYPGFRFEFSSKPPVGKWHDNVSYWIEVYAEQRVRRPVHTAGGVPRVRGTPEDDLIELFDQVDQILVAGILHGLEFENFVVGMIDDLKATDARWEMSRYD